MRNEKKKYEIGCWRKIIYGEDMHKGTKRTVVSD
jgi:hypothetical protein